MVSCGRFKWREKILYMTVKKHEHSHLLGEKFHYEHGKIGCNREKSQRIWQQQRFEESDKDTDISPNDVLNCRNWFCCFNSLSGGFQRTQARSSARSLALLKLIGTGWSLPQSLIGIKAIFGGPKPVRHSSCERVIYRPPTPFTVNNHSMSATRPFH